jgi:inosine-uridine nucleoside N-ribohydrolase
MTQRRRFLQQTAALGMTLLPRGEASAHRPEEHKKAIPILLDTDIGTDVDDAFALALILASPELELRGITTVGSDPQTRARLACRFVNSISRHDVPVAAGAAPQPQEDIEKQVQYAKQADELPKRITHLVKATAVEFLYRQLKQHPGELTLLTVGPLTNIARLLREHPDCQPWIKRLVMMGGSVDVGYNGKAPPEVEWNIKCDIPAAQTVFESGVPLTLAPLDATTMLTLEEPLRRRLFEAGTPLTEQVRALYRLWGKPTPTLYDPVAVTLCFEERYCTLKDLRLEVDDKGMTRRVKGKPNSRVATAIHAADFLRWYVERVRAARPEMK